MKKIYLLLVTILFPLASNGQKTTRLSFDDAIKLALENNANVKVQSLERKVAKKVIYQNLALGLPSISVGQNYTDNIELPAQFFDINGDGVQDKLQFGNRYSAVGGVGVNQLVFDGSYIVAVLASRVLTTQAQENYKKSILQAKQDVSQAYHLAIVLEKNLGALETTIKSSKESLKSIKAMAKEGFVEDLEADQLDLILKNLEINSINLVNQIYIAHQLLTLHCGLSPESKLNLTSSIESLLISPNAAQALLASEFDVSNHVDFKLMESNRMGQKLNLKNEKVQFLPKIYAGYNLNRQFVSEDANVFDPDGFQSNNVNFSSWNLSASLPIFNSGRRIAKIQEERIKLQELDILLENTEMGLILKHKQARAEYANSLKIYQLQLEGAKVSKQILKNAEAKLRAGTISSMEYAQVSNQYQESITSMLQSANNTLNKKVALETSLGELK
jgi:outer membrane protein TolC